MVLGNNVRQELESIYAAGAAQQQTRYESALATFRQIYGSDGEINIFRAPGRVNLIGEHTDYNHGYVLPVALDKDVLLLARPRADEQIHLANIDPNFPATSFEIKENIPLAPAGDWSNYARGAAHAIMQATSDQYQGNGSITGFDALVVGAEPFGVPIGSGLSSSSALTVVMVTALAHFSSIAISKVAQVQVSSDAEWYVGTRGGIMDQFIALLAQRDHALFLDCRPNTDGSYQTEAVPLSTEYRIMVVDSGVHHSNVGGEFNQRVAACRAGVGLLQKAVVEKEIAHLRDVDTEVWASISSLLPEQTTRAELAAWHIDLHALGLLDMPGIEEDTPLHVLARCRHVVSENQRVLDAVKAMQLNDIATFGQLMDQAHASARDDYEISCPEIDLLVTASRQVDGVVGARLTGAGWGGCMVALVHQEATEQFNQHVSSSYAQKLGRAPTIFTCQSMPGAGLVYTL